MSASSSRVKPNSARRSSQDVASGSVGWMFSAGSMVFPLIMKFRAAQLPQMLLVGGFGLFDRVYVPRTPVAANEDAGISLNVEDKQQPDPKTTGHPRRARHPHPRSSLTNQPLA